MAIFLLRTVIYHVTSRETFPHLLPAQRQIERQMRDKQFLQM